MSDEKFMNETNESTHVTEKEYFISNEKFDLLKKYQQLVFDNTQVSPALKKLANSVITEENLEKVAKKIIDSLN